MNNNRTASSLFPCGQTRREFVWEMGGGFAGVALASLLAGDGFFARNAHAGSPQSPADKTLAGPLAPKPPHFPVQAKSVIILLMNGGPSQVDTFDHKPALDKFGVSHCRRARSLSIRAGERLGF